VQDTGEGVSVVVEVGDHAVKRISRRWLRARLSHNGRIKGEGVSLPGNEGRKRVLANTASILVARHRKDIDARMPAAEAITLCG
jgi:hypothetical protein